MVWKQKESSDDQLSCWQLTDFKKELTPVFSPCFFKVHNYYVLCEKIDFLSDAEYHGNLPKAVIHASVLLKTFLRSMGEPIITNRLYPQVLVVSGNLFFVKLTCLMVLELNDSDDRIHGIRELFQNLPTENYVLLRAILKFLTEVKNFFGIIPCELITSNFRSLLIVIRI